MNKIILTALIATTLGACATNPNNIPDAYVSSMEYRGWSCEDIGNENALITSESETLFKQMKTKRDVNVTMAVVGAVVFWPVLFAMQGKDPVADAKLSELRGRSTALARAGSEAGCEPIVTIASMECESLQERLDTLVRLDRYNDATKRNQLRRQISSNDCGSA